ncbi:Ger(x)C family spore germination protein [Paenibacillus sp. chi10]|uniref:Ger(X)C family spore germination protein n=1 Tax=Paenibacillus suaedae TaxID=3077233 RepID=A0AAJ2JUX2_9BACL|nr:MULTISPECIES: Ger(x)C family spore germination protein [unclassified Paenibacillus]MDT8974707.1 Ger(x)C family spore germination protein [Paenibacillus sp. chi10]GAV10645.1 spore germination protein [Paenibacillus sp. NAIST15-1]
MKLLFQYLFKAVCALTMLVLLTSCVQTSVLEKLGLSVAIGYDALPEGKLKVTSVLTNPEPEAKKKTKIVSCIASSSKGARINNNRQLSHTLVNGQVRVVVFDDKLGKQGITDVVENLTRDPFFGDMIFLAVSEGPSHELLHHNYEQIPNIGTYLYQMLQQHIQDDWVPSCTVHDYRSAFYSAGRDPVLPMLRKLSNGVEIYSLALFQEDRVVGTIGAGESYLLKLLLGKLATLKELIIDREELRPYLHENRKADGRVRVVISTLGSKKHIRLLSASPLKFQTNLHINVELQEITDEYDFSQPQSSKLLQQKIGETLTKETEALIKKLQHLGSDPIGFGEVYRSSVRHSKLTADKWKKMFPEASIQSQVEVNIVRTGTIE